MRGEDDLDAAFEPGDWRGAPDRSAPAAVTSPAYTGPCRRSRPRSPDPLHLRARPAGIAVERERAREVVASARGAVTRAFDDIRSGRRVDLAQFEPVVAGIAASVSRCAAAIPSVTRLKEVHEYTFLHSVAVCGLMLALAKELSLPEGLAQEIGLAGLLHDIGKARVPVALLDKPGPLDLAEYAVVQQHTVRGRELLEEAGIRSSIALDVCLHHHERADGRGYPIGLPLPDISLHARMAAVCDVYDAVTSRRSYKDSWSPGEALEWMAGTSGQFDPRVLAAFRRVLGPFPTGALVRLQSGRLAMVVREGDDPAAPEVCVFWDADTRRALAPRRVSTDSDPVVGLERAEWWGLENWPQQRAALLASFPAAR
jgi:putative nucleotidyltransferase with HDIG domain